MEQINKSYLVTLWVGDSGEAEETSFGRMRLVVVQHLTETPRVGFLLWPICICQEEILNKSRLFVQMLRV